jgi:hypothetical protein
MGTLIRALLRWALLAAVGAAAVSVLRYALDRLSGDPEMAFRAGSYDSWPAVPHAPGDEASAV